MQVLAGRAGALVRTVIMLPSPDKCNARRHQSRNDHRLLRAGAAGAMQAAWFMQTGEQLLFSEQCGSNLFLLPRAASAGTQPTKAF